MRDPKGIINSKPLLRLEAQHLDVVDALVWGLEAPDDRLPGIEPGQPLSVASAATFLDMRRAYIRRLLEDRLFRATYDKAVSAQRSALAPEAIAAIGELIDWQGEGAAVDAGVRLRAAALALNDEKAAALNVNVQLNNQLTFKPGYVVRLPPGDPLPATIHDGELPAPPPV